MGKKRVWMYCRIAHQSAADDFSMAAQVESLKEYASRNNLSIVGISTEYGSGLTLDRPGLMEVKKAVQGNEVNAVLVKNLSRIARGRPGHHVLIAHGTLSGIKKRVFLQHLSNAIRTLGMVRLRGLEPPPSCPD